MDVSRFFIEEIYAEEVRKYLAERCWNHAGPLWWKLSRCPHGGGGETSVSWSKEVDGRYTVSISAFKISVDAPPRFISSPQNICHSKKKVAFSGTLLVLEGCRPTRDRIELLEIADADRLFLAEVSKLHLSSTEWYER